MIFKLFYKGILICSSRSNEVIYNFVKNEKLEEEDIEIKEEVTDSDKVRNYSRRF